MNKIVFICRGNIYRSQIAKGLCDFLSEGKVAAESYGTQVDLENNAGVLISEFPGMKDTIEILKRGGVDISKEYCKQVTPEVLQGADKIIVMCEREYIPAWLNTCPYEFWDIPNPSTVTSTHAENTIKTVKSKVQETLKNLAR